ncbi:unnamed protein product [Cuscuta campestris]|uniref:Retrotransposon Copia-like N-terminal domain-containing protein n=1 Tax=Cuscuta campestris TaxID=132261 RepID=A0A484NC31_9ASTE|nr:unnamed protein product [Cuscuta campestris]
MASSDKPSENSTSSSSSNAPHLAFTTISNVKLHVPIQLSFSQPNYKKWSRLFLLLVRRFTLHGFLSGSNTPSADDDEWYQLDALIQVSNHHQGFDDNGRQTLRNIADWLDDVDAPVSESQLVLQMLRGLPDDLQALTSFLQFQQPLPTFLQTRSALLLLERQRQTIMDDAGKAVMAGRTGSSPYGGSSGGFGRSGGMPGSGHNGGSGGGRGQQGSNSGRGGGGRGRGRGRNSGISRKKTKMQEHFFQVFYSSTEAAFSAHHTPRTQWTHQGTQFTHDILERAGMITCRPISTLVDTKAKLSGTSGPLVAEPALQYLTFTRPDISYSVQQLCLHLHAPRDVHVTAMNRATISRSSAEAEYRAVANAVAETS